MIITLIYLQVVTKFLRSGHLFKMYHFDHISYTVHIILNIQPQIENIVLHLNKTNSVNVPVYYKHGKLILIQVKLILSVCYRLLLWETPL